MPRVKQDYERMSLGLSPALLHQVREFRHAYALATNADAIRVLLEHALKSPPKLVKLPPEQMTRAQLMKQMADFEREGEEAEATLLAKRDH